MDHQHIQLIGVGLANLGLVAGLVAAYYWWMASRVAIVPPWAGFMPLNAAQALQGWVTAINTALEESGKLNTYAAISSGVAVLSSTFGSYLASVA